MPPQSALVSLEALALSAVFQLVVSACQALKKKYVDCDELTRRQQVEALQEYLLSKCGPLLDKVFKLVQGIIDEDQDIDIRMLYSVVMRNNMRVLKFRRFLGYSDIFGRIKKCSQCQFLLYNDAHFWLGQLMKFKCLVDLDISCLRFGPFQVNAFQIITDNCSASLEKICFVPTLDDGLFIHVLSYLQNCKELTAIHMFWGDRDLTIQPREVLLAINNVIESLPKLEILDITGISSLLLSYDHQRVKPFKSLSLNYLPLYDHPIDSKSVGHLLSDCPNLKELEFSKLRYDDYSTVSTNSSDGKNIIDILSQESLSFSSLWLTVHPGMNLSELWTGIGVRLHTLKLHPCYVPNPMNYHKFVTIGQLCPNLKVLEVGSLGYFDSDAPTGELEPLAVNSTMFAKLTRINLYNTSVPRNLSRNGCWDPAILDLVFRNSKNFTHIKLCNITANMFDDTLQMLGRKSDSMSNLTTLELVGSTWNLQCAQKLLSLIMVFCPNLVLMSTHSFLSLETVVFLTRFAMTMKKENFVFKLSCFNTANNRQVL